MNNIIFRVIFKKMQVLEDVRSFRNKQKELNENRRIKLKRF